MPETAHILILDDNPVFRKAVRTIIHFRYPDVRLHEADRAEDALSKAERHRPVLILMDIHLRGRLSLELIRKLHRIRPEATIVVMTGSDSVEYREKVLQNGADHFLSKTTPSGSAILELVGSQI